MSSMEISGVPSNEMEAKGPANPESGEVRNQPEETGNEPVIFISGDSFQGRSRNLMGSDASVEEEDGPLIGQVTGFLGSPLPSDKNKRKQGQLFKSQLTKRFTRNRRKKNVWLASRPAIAPATVPTTPSSLPPSPPPSRGEGSSSDSSEERLRTFEERLRNVKDPDAWTKKVEDFKRRDGNSSKFAVPDRFRGYIQPKFLSIGPLESAISPQWRLFKLELTKRFINDHMSQSAEALCNDILKKIVNFTECYDKKELNNRNMDDQQLAWKFFIGGCALIQFVKCYYYYYESFRDYVIEIHDEKMKDVVTDLFLVNNQLPLEVLNLVMGFSEGRELLRMSIHRLVEEIVEMLHGRAKDKKADSKTDQSFSTTDQSLKEANHLLELVWMKFVKKTKDNHFVEIKAIPRPFRSVKELQAVGIILEPNNSSSSLRDISFNRGKLFCKLKIPPFCVTKQSRLLIVNLIAFEMSPNFKNKNDRVVASYTSFLNSLMATKEDVEELRMAGILVNYLLNDEDILQTFRDFTSPTKPYFDIFSGIKGELTEYFNDKKRMTTGKWLSEAMCVYFRSPWSTLAFISATFLLILTIIQTIFSVLAYFDHK